MLLQNYDPNSVKLYSKCARNQASRFSQKKRPASSSRLYSSLIVYNQSQKKKKNICTFDMIESRQQRQKKYRATITPAVGQYNPKTQNKIKLTWDILKIYKTRSQSRQQGVNIKTVIKQNKQQNRNETDENQNNEINQVMATEISQKAYVPQINKSTHNFQTQTNHGVERSDSGREINSRQYPRRLKSQNSRYKTLKSQVDMSKMTGREDSKHHLTIESQQPLKYKNIDLNKSIQYIKSKPSLNFQFQRQLSREKVGSLKKQHVVPSDYSYNYNVIKPNPPKLVSFSTTKGRQWTNKSLNESCSYDNYDYERYVWGSKSNVFSNTKTHVTDFKKQTKRILFKR